MYLGTIWQDIVYAMRAMRRNPAFTATALAALAIGIGANSAIFSVVNAVLLKPLAYPDADRIVLFYLTTVNGPSYGGSATKFNVWRRQTGAFQQVAAYEYNGVQLNLAGGPIPEQVHAIHVSAGYFLLLGARMALGRGFTEEEDQPGGGHIAVISYGLWQRSFAGDSRAAGRTLSLSGTPYLIVGVMARDFETELDTPPDVWLPFQIDPNSSDHAQYFNVIGRLRPGVSLEMANAKLSLAVEEFRARFPDIAGPRDRFAVRPFGEAIVSDVRSSLLILAGAVGLVLLIACANVANLLLVRASGRRREMAIRAAIGAARGRIVRQLLVESTMLAAIGGALGLGLGMVGLKALLAGNPGDIPRIGEHGSAILLDWRLAAFTVGLSLLTGLVFGLAPALEVSRPDVSGALKDGGRTGAGRRQNKVRAFLVVSEVALALVLLIGAALLIRTFLALRGVRPGFDRHNVLTVRVSLAGSNFRRTADVRRLIWDACRRFESTPGVARAAASYLLPLEGAFGVPFHIVGRPAAGGRWDGRGWIGVSPGYFEVFRIPISHGRGFGERDDASAPRVAIINQAMARRFWPNADPLGQRVLLGEGYGPEFEEPERQIIGVAGDVRDFGLDREPAPVVYVPLAQVTDGLTAVAARAASLAFAVRTRVEPHSLIVPVQRGLLEASALPSSSVRTMDEVARQSTARADFDMSVLTVFGGCALLLAAIGIYGVMAYSIRQRTREMGIRMALGAEGRRVRNMILLQGMRLALLGIAIGVGAAFGLTRLMAGFLFQVKPWDPAAFVLVPILLAAVAMGAVWFPAVRAARIDPVAALRAE